jgi:Uma2 family endonuclease
MEGEDAMPSSTCSDERLTYEDLLRIPEDGMRHEIIDGVHYVTASPNLRHQQLLGRLYFAIESALRAQPVGHVFLSPLDVVFTKWDVVEPDLLFVSSAQRHILTKANVQGAPDLVVEIFSPSTQSRDEQIKRQLFERAGVGEYWMLDPDRSVVLVCRRDADGHLTDASEFSEAGRGTLTTPLIPGLALPMSELFAD